MKTFTAIAVLFMLAVSANAQFAGEDCPPKSGDVYKLGMMGSPTAWRAIWLAAEHAVNSNALSNKPSVGCFDFDISLFTDDEASSDLLCKTTESWEDTPGVPTISDGQLLYLDPDMPTDECADVGICFPENALRCDTHCTAARGEPCAKWITDTADVVGVIGAGCSGPTIEAASYLETLDIPLISPSATSPTLSDVVEFPNFFRTCPGDAGQSKALVDLAASFGIQKAAVIATRDPYSQGFAEGIVQFGPEMGIEITTFELICEDTDCSEYYNEVYDAVKSIKDSGAKVIFSTSHCINHQLIKSIAYDLDMTAENCYQWYGGDGRTNDGCINGLAAAGASNYASTFDTTAVPLEASLGSVGTYPRGGSGDVYKDFIGYWAEQDVCDFPGQIHNEGETDLEGYTTEAYDAVLSYAMAIKAIREAGGEVTGAAIIEELDKDGFSFQGATGIVSFGGDYEPPIGDHDRPPVYDIKAYEGKWLTVGYWSPVELTAVNLFFPIIFPTATFDPPACLTEP